MCGERLRANAGGCESLAHTKVERGGKGYRRKGKSIGGERFVSGRGESSLSREQKTERRKLCQVKKNSGTNLNKTETINPKP